LVGLITAALLFAGRFDQAAACIEQLVRFTPSHGCPATATAGALAGAARLVAAFAGADGAARTHFIEALAELALMPGPRDCYACPG
jgi:C4-dicarboxylate transporter